MSTLVSVIVPVYNPGERFERCVESIIGQTYSNLDIILVDDGSSDGSEKLCDEFAKKDSRITVIHQPNGGVSNARNNGLKVCKGDYVCFVDSDDYIENNMVSVAVSHIFEEGCQLVSFGYTKELPGGKIKEITMPSIYERANYKVFDDYVCKGYSLQVWNKLIKKDIIIKYFNEHYKTCEDMLFSSQFYNGYIKTCITKEILYHKTGDCLCKKYPDDYLQGINLILSKVTKNLDVSLNKIPHFCAHLYLLTLSCIASKSEDEKKIVLKTSRNLRKVLLKNAKAQTFKNKVKILLAKMGLEKLVLKLCK